MRGTAAQGQATPPLSSILERSRRGGMGANTQQADLGVWSCTAAGIPSLAICSPPSLLSLHQCVSWSLSSRLWAVGVRRPLSQVNLPSPGFPITPWSATRATPGPREMAGLRLRKEADLEVKIEVDK